MRQKGLSIASLFVLILLWPASEILAEPYAAVYGGFSLLNDTDFRTDVSLAGEPRLEDNLVVSTIDTVRGVDFSTEVDNSPIFGGKAGYWFDFFPFVGVELDIYTFKPDITVPPQTATGTATVGDDGQEEDATITLSEPFEFDVRVVTIGFNLLGRYPLFKSPRYARGRLQPYLGVGPGLFVTTIKDKEDDPANNIGKKTLAFGGLQAVGGFKVFILKKLSIFAEYKFTYFTADLSGASELFSLGARQNIIANHFYGGIAYHFY